MQPAMSKDTTARENLSILDYPTFLDTKPENQKNDDHIIMLLLGQ